MEGSIYLKSNRYKKKIQNGKIIGRKKLMKSVVKKLFQSKFSKSGKGSRNSMLKMFIEETDKKKKKSRSKKIFSFDSSDSDSCAKGNREKYIRQFIKNGPKNLGPKKEKLSVYQRGVYIDWERNPDDTQYNLFIESKVQGEKFQPSVLSKALRIVRSHHRALQVDHIEVIEGVPHMVYLSEQERDEKYSSQEDLQVIDLQKFSKEKIRIEEEKEFAKMRATLTDLKNGPIDKHIVFKYSADKHCVYMGFNHVVVDGIGIQLATMRVLSVYAALIGNPKQKVFFRNDDSIKVGNAEFNGFLNSIPADKREKEKAYWEKKLANKSFYFDFNMGKKIMSEKGSNQGLVTLEIEKSFIASVQRISKKIRSTPFVVFSALFSSFLCKFFGRKKIVLGYQMNLRPKNLTRSVGYYINQLYFSVDKFIEKKNFMQLCLKMNRQLKKDKIMGYFDFSKFSRPSEVSRINVCIQEFLIDSCVNIADCKWFPGAKMDKYEPMYDLFLLYDVFGGGTNDEKKPKIRYRFNKTVFKREFIEKLIVSFVEFSKKLVKNSRKPLNKIDVLLKNEKNKQIVEFNDTKVDYGSYQLCERFEKISAKFRNKIAVEFNDENITYSELNFKANQLGRYIKNNYEIKKEKEEYIGICIDKSINLIIGIIGVYKAGGVYQPIDPKLPIERNKFMLENTNCKVIICDKKNKKIFQKFFEGKLIVIDSKIDSDLIRKEKTKNLVINNSDSHAAYIIFTSGSTGKPKGVIQEMKSLVNFCCTYNDKLEIKPEDRCSLFCNISFDVSVSEIFGVILFGATLVVIPEDIRLDFTLLQNYLIKKNLDVVYLPPSILRVFPRKKFTNRVLIYAGESCNEDTLKYWVRKVPILINGYGPTETNYCTFKIIEKEFTFSTNIGKPFNNYSCYILNEELSVVPIGVTGELYVSGFGVARGYLNLPELTNKRFIVNPFNKTEKLYKTGDLCRYLSNGDILFLGRADFQVKIRGFRIELGSIEKNIMTNKNITDVIVIVKNNEKLLKKQIIAYLIVSEKIYNNSLTSKAILKSKIIKNLKAELPNYMIPSSFVFLTSFPLNTSGKIDRKQLLKLDFSVIDKTKFVAPVTDFEVKLEKIWKKFFKKKNVGLYENFFELGGDSIMLMQMNSVYKKKLNLELSIKDLYENPTIFDLSESYGKEYDKSFKVMSNKINGRKYYFNEINKSISEGEGIALGKRMYVMEEGVIKQCEKVIKISEKISVVLKQKRNISIDNLLLSSIYMLISKISSKNKVLFGIFSGKNKKQIYPLLINLKYSLLEELLFHIKREHKKIQMLEEEEDEEEGEEEEKGDVEYFKSSEVRFPIVFNAKNKSLKEINENLSEEKRSLIDVKYVSNEKEIVIKVEMIELTLFEIDEFVSKIISNFYDIINSVFEEFSTSSVTSGSKEGKNKAKRIVTSAITSGFSQIVFGNQISNEFSLFNECIKPLQPMGNEAPLFMIHPVFGLSELYLKIAGEVNLKNQPFYGLNYPKITKLNEHFSTAQDYVKYFVKSMLYYQKKHTNKKKMRLFAFCGGGELLYHVAKFLEDNNIEVELCFFVDPVHQYKYPVDSVSIYKKRLETEMGATSESKFLLLRSIFNTLLSVFGTYASLGRRDKPVLKCNNFVIIRARKELHKGRYTTINEMLSDIFSLPRDKFVNKKDEFMTNLYLGYDKLFNEETKKKCYIVDGDHFDVVMHEESKMVSKILRKTLKDLKGEKFIKWKNDFSLKKKKTDEMKLLKETLKCCIEFNDEKSIKYLRDSGLNVDEILKKINTNIFSYLGIDSVRRSSYSSTLSYLTKKRFERAEEIGDLLNKRRGSASCSMIGMRRARRSEKIWTNNVDFKNLETYQFTKADSDEQRIF